jgi:hypothetical protein
MRWLLFLVHTTTLVERSIIFNLLIEGVSFDFIDHKMSGQLV